MSSAPHAPVNDFNADQTRATLGAAFRTALADANSPSTKNAAVYKPTSGGWTSSKPAVSAGAAASRVLAEMAKSLKSVDSPGTPAAQPAAAATSPAAGPVSGGPNNGHTSKPKKK